jgi:hypothetical protein
MPGLILDPNASDVEAALDEIVAVMRKYGFALGASKDKPGIILLGRISDGLNQATVVAEILRVTHNYSDWRPIEPGKKAPVLQ